VTSISAAFWTDVLWIVLLQALPLAHPWHPWPRSEAAPRVARCEGPATLHVTLALNDPYGAGVSAFRNLFEAV
jgi:hypothetical protein